MQGHNVVAAPSSSSRSIIGRRRHPLHCLARFILTSLPASLLLSPPIYLAGTPRRSQLLAHHRLVSNNGEI
ncbi:unnamed protein product [Linum trigynum]|uniref:Uncharacterized protein n=1 Tax=Linum trigynum TaxID=586398 RepID=A0AAV2GMV1_9ROSI